MLLPWVHETSRRSNRRDVELFFDCRKCMQEVSVLERQLMGCGYEAPPPAPLRARPWDHFERSPRWFERDETGAPTLAVCPGYACGLPEVIEASHAVRYFEAGELTQFCDGKQATPMLKLAITELKNETDRMQAWALANPEKKS